MSSVTTPSLPRRSILMGAALAALGMSASKPSASPRREIQTVTELIEALGVDELADFFGVSCNAVAAWEARGFLSPGWHMRLSQHVEAKGLKLSPSVFGA